MTILKTGLIQGAVSLSGELRGWWSRRINGEHRLVYRVTGSGDEQRLEVAQCRHHY